jgi:hypothetical protein
MQTIFEKLLSLMVHNRSSNTILHYIENKGWFSEYKTHQPNIYMRIPYDKWLNNTLINFKHIEILNEFIFNGHGTIRVVSISDKKWVEIEGSQLDPFKSRTPKQHILQICHKKKNTRPLLKYLNEFYYYDFRHYRCDETDMKYAIDYSLWVEYFKIEAQEILELKKYIDKGILDIRYKDGEPDEVLIAYTR